MDVIITVVGTAVVSGVAILILKRKRRDPYLPGLPPEDFGFHAEIGGGVWSFGALTPGDAEASAGELVEGMRGE